MHVFVVLMNILVRIYSKLIQQISPKNNETSTYIARIKALSFSK